MHSTLWKPSYFALCILLVITSISSVAADSQNWFRQTALSPDGKTILFTAKGDIYKVSSQGGKAVALVTGDHWEGHPVWSNDGNKIAFASDKAGSLDVYVVSAQGGQPSRLTFHSVDDIPTHFSANNKHVMFNSGRMPLAQSSAFPSGRMPQLYQVNIKGGTPEMVVETPVLEGDLSESGRHLVYMDNKGYEDKFRKHDLSSFARDIWHVDLKSGKHTQLTEFKGGDSSPVWGKDEKTIFYLSEQASGTYNVWRMKKDGNDKQQVTRHKTHPVRSLSASDNGKLAYSYHGDIYTLVDGEKPKKLAISLASVSTINNDLTLNIAKKAKGYAVSPNGKEIAFIARGDLFVTSVEFGTTVRLTETPEQERSVSWLPDGKSLIFDAERDGIWGLYQVSLADDKATYFFSSTNFKESTLVKNQNEAFQPKVSPDGKQIAYVKQRDEIRVMDLKTKKSHTVFNGDLNYSYADGDISFDWSPDSQWITASYIPYGMYAFSNIGIAPADGSSAPKDISLSGYGDYTPIWVNNDVILFASSRYGRIDHGSWGSALDVMGVFLTDQAFARFKQNKEERTLLAEAEDKAKEGEDKDTKKAAEETPKAEPVVIDWAGIESRTARMTIHSSDLAGMALTPKGDKLYYLAKFEKGFDLWLHDIKEKKTSLAVKLNAKKASMALSDKGDAVFVLADGKFAKIAVEESHKKTDIAYAGTITLDAKQERLYMFDHIWRQTQDKFYKSDLHGVDWSLMNDAYRPKVAALTHNRDFATLASELLGELNASHTGGRYRKKTLPHAQTASLGLIYSSKATSKGVVVADILPNSPLKASSPSLSKGATITHINGKQVNSNNNFYAAMNGTAGKRTRITFKDGRKSFDVVTRPMPLALESKGLYERWVNERRAMVDELSKGQLIYVHIPQMDDKAYRKLYSDVFGPGFNKKALVVDTRFNRGGWLTDDLVTFLSGKQYTWEHGRGVRYKGDSMKRWTKPSIVVMNEGNYSDGHCFPSAYKANNIGQTVGMPVPGTCTAVWWEMLQTDDVVFGIPQLGVTDLEGTFLENNQLLPDVQIKNTPETMAKGQDLQLQKAVELLMR